MYQLSLNVPKTTCDPPLFFEQRIFNLTPFFFNFNFQSEETDDQENEKV